MLTFRTGNTIVLITEKYTGANKYAIFVFPMLSLIFFVLPYFPFFNKLSLLTRLLRYLTLIYLSILGPGYDTYKAIEHRKNITQERMLAYWLILGLSYTLYSILESIVFADLFELLLYLNVIFITIWRYYFSEALYRIVFRPIFELIRRTTLRSVKGSH